MPNIKFLMGEKELMRDQSDYVRLRVASIIKDMIPDLKSVYFTISGYFNIYFYFNFSLINNGRNNKINTKL